MLYKVALYSMSSALKKDIFPEDTPPTHKILLPLIRYDSCEYASISNPSAEVNSAILCLGNSTFCGRLAVRPLSVR